jgi:uncharacterized protein (DUF305 family)
MQPISLKTGFLALTILAIASTTGGFLTACSSVSSNQSGAPNPSNTDAGNMPHMGHESNMDRGNASASDDAGSMQHGGHGSGMAHSMAMDLGPADANYDLRFIDAMRLHHRGAIAMAKEAEQKSQRREIKSLARNIITAQNREENELLRKWRQAWYPQASNDPVTYGGEGKPVILMSNELQQSMAMLKDLGSADAEFDLRFMNGMIEHHEGAIAMAKDALSKSKRPEIKQLAQEIATSQQVEIDQMKQWRKAWYKQ